MCDGLHEIAIVVMATSRALAGWGRLLGTDTRGLKSFLADTMHGEYRSEQSMGDEALGERS